MSGCSENSVTKPSCYLASHSESGTEPLFIDSLIQDSRNLTSKSLVKDVAPRLGVARVEEA